MRIERLEGRWAGWQERDGEFGWVGRKEAKRRSQDLERLYIDGWWGKSEQTVGGFGKTVGQRIEFLNNRHSTPQL